MDYALLPRYIASFAIYGAIIRSILIKFAFDANSIPNLCIVLSKMGIIFSLVGILGSYFGEKLHKRLIADVTEYQKTLDLSVTREEFLHFRYTTITSFIFMIFYYCGTFYRCCDDLIGL